MAGALVIEELQNGIVEPYLSSRQVKLSLSTFLTTGVGDHFDTPINN